MRDDRDSPQAAASVRGILRLAGATAFLVGLCLLWAAA